MGGVKPAAAGVSPLDEELELLPGSLTPPLQEALVRLGTWIPFEKAGELLGELMRMSSVSEGTVRRQTEQAGASYVAIQEQAVEQLEQGMELERCGGTEAKVVMGKVVMEVDGAMVPLVGGEWAEVKTVVIGQAGELEEIEGQVSVEEVSSFSRLTNSDDFARLSLVETHLRGVDKAEQVGVVADGAEWIQNFADYHRPDAVRILDFPHAAQYVSAIGQACAHRSLQTILRKANIGLTCERAQCIPAPFNLASTTSLLALSTAPLPMGQPCSRKVG